MSEMSVTNEQVRAGIAEQAAAWFVENRGGPLDAAARVDFTEWLRASPVHVQEYLAVAVLSRDLPAATNNPQASLESLLAAARADADNVVSLTPARAAAVRAIPAPARARWSATWPLAAAASLVLVICAALWSVRDGDPFGLPKTYSTVHGELSVRALPDGSLLHLNTDSELTVRYSRGERLVELTRGEALFQVAHDDKRRFRVAAGEAGMLAVGTQFDVYRGPGAAKVTVIEGTVAVFTAAAPQAAQRVEAGYQVDVGERVGPLRAVDTRAALAWLQRRIAFENRPLGEVAGDFNRYGRIPLEIEGQELRNLPISGAFDAYDTDSFAAFLGTLSGVQVDKGPKRILVRKLAPATREPLPLAP
jgi:transmembrane sensor